MKFIRENRNLFISAGIVLAVFYLIGTLIWVTGTSRAANGIEGKVRSCAGVLTTTINMIKETSAVNTQFQDFSTKLAEALAGNPESTQSIVALAATQSKTDYAQTATEVQRVIQAQRGEFQLCQDGVIDRQVDFKGRLVGFGWIFNIFWNKPDELPSSAFARPTKDNDDDGIITVLDYLTVTSKSARDSFSTGDDSGPIDLKPASTPTQ
jgi:hypothetical protein